MDGLIEAIGLLDAKYQELNLSNDPVSVVGRRIVFSALCRLNDELRHMLTGRA